MPDSYENPENISYAHKHEKYPKGYYHKILKKLKYQKYFTKWKTTFIFVDLHFPERLWYFVNFKGGNSVPQLSRICDLLNSIDSKNKQPYI